MKDQEAVQKAFQFSRLRLAQFEPRDHRPLLRCQRANDLSRAGSEFDFIKIGRKAKLVQKSEFKGEDRLRLWRMSGDDFQHVVQLVIDRRQRRVRFSRLLDEAGAVSGLLQPAHVLAQRRVHGFQLHLAQRVQLRALTAREAEFREIKQIQLACEGRFGTARAFSHRADASAIRREPIHDETRLRERTRTEDDAGGGLDHGWKKLRLTCGA